MDARSFQSLLTFSPVSGVVPIISSLLVNVATSELPLSLNPYLQYAWPLLALVTAIGVALSFVLSRLQKNVEEPTITIENQNRQRMLKRVRAFWITGLLEHSLRNELHITLGLNEQSDAVANPREFTLHESRKQARPLPLGSRIIDVYDQADGELLILGEPGVGKTMLLLELTRDLLDRAEQDNMHPMPIVFNLASWALKRQSLADWLIEELNKLYQVPHKIGQIWIDTGQVLLLLDGLDEVPSAHRLACIKAINTYRKSNGLVSIVVCSRNDEYKIQKKRLQLNTAVVVQPLSTHGLRNELTGSEHVSKNDLLEGKETPISQQGDLHDKYRRFLGAYPYLC